MIGNDHVRFGPGPLEKGLLSRHLASGLPATIGAPADDPTCPNNTRQLLSESIAVERGSRCSQRT